MASSIRQSVTIPADLAVEVERVTRKKHLTKSRALVVLAQRGLEAEAAARESLNATYSWLKPIPSARAKRGRI
jgi:hypothetical protein